MSRQATGRRWIHCGGRLLCSLLLCAMASVYAQDAIKWEDLSEPEQNLLQEMQSQWDSLAPERQQQLRRGANRWLQMEPDERNRARRQRDFFQQLSPEEREGLQQRFQQFNSVPQTQQQRLREIQEQFRRLPPAQREELRQRFENQRDIPSREERLLGLPPELPDAQQRPELDSVRPPPINRPGQELPRNFPRINRPEIQPDTPHRPQPPRH
ncbi:MAG: DUF3106 domain-containing protein [Pseudomonadales bacterium]|nr:DUF3106 domain-containing protein [Pseudomonadales bacterium]